MYGAATGKPYSYRNDQGVPVFPDDHPIFIFDGHCALCSGWARFILRRDRRQRFRLLAAQTPLGQALYRHYGLDPVGYETAILLTDGVAWLQSEGAIRVAEGLGWPWSWLAGLRLVPLRWRDAAYRSIARNRFRLFGRRARCYLAEPGQEHRFLA